MASLTHVQKVRLLYKSCLKLHRGLPIHLKAIGDTYVKDEFKRHKAADQAQVQIFMEAWAVILYQLIKHQSIINLFRNMPLICQSRWE